jgi:chemotaxis protein MotA
MFFIIGLVVVFGAVLGGYILAGGKLAPIIKAAPFEFIIIAGSAAGAALMGNSFSTFKAAISGFFKVLKGPRYNKDDYLKLIVTVAKLLNVIKKEGVVALEAHVENPDASPIIGEFPKLATDHELLQYICDPLKLIVISQGNVDPDAAESIMNTALKTHHHHAMQASTAITTIAGSLPALGIVACVLGVVKTMGAIDQPPAVLGALIGAALVGTMLGVFLSYGIAEPVANRLSQIIDDESQTFKVVKAMIVANLQGHAQPVMIEFARSVLSHHDQPTFSDVFDGIRGG